MKWPFLVKICMRERSFPRSQTTNLPLFRITATFLGYHNWPSSLPGIPNWNLYVPVFSNTWKEKSKHYLLSKWSLIFIKCSQTIQIRQCVNKQRQYYRPITMTMYESVYSWSREHALPHRLHPTAHNNWYSTWKNTEFYFSQIYGCTSYCCFHTASIWNIGAYHISTSSADIL